MTEDDTFTGKDVVELTRRICQAPIDDPGTLSGRDTMLLQIMLSSYGLVLFKYIAAFPSLFADISISRPIQARIVATLIEECRNAARNLEKGQCNA